MKNANQLAVLLFLGLASALPAQNQPVNSERPGAETGAAASIYCPAPCPCQGAFNQIKVYYFGVNGAKVEVFANSGLSTLIATFNPVNSGQLLTINAAGLPGGTFSTYIYLRTTKPGESSCVTKIYALCPTEAWPGALEDLNILGKTYDDFTVFSRTDSNSNAECNLDNVEQDWHVGGNIIGPAKNTLGTRTNENMVIITNDLPRGVVTKTGNFGLGTTAPSTRLEVAGNTLLNGTLDVSGIARMNNGAGSTAPGNGALVVTGGTGIGGNLNVGGNADVDGTATVGNNLTVEAAGVTRLQSSTSSTSTTTGALVVTGGTGIGGNLNVGGSFDVDNNANVDGSLQVDGSGRIDGRLIVGNPITAPGAHELYVNGSAIAEEVVVKLQPFWPDYVFEKNYDLQPLSEVEKFIAAEKRLPGVVSARDVAENGLSLGAMQKAQMEKIEEIYLHLIEMNKQLQTVKAENEVLKLRVAELEKR